MVAQKQVRGWCYIGPFSEVLLVSREHLQHVEVETQKSGVRQTSFWL